MALVVLEDDVMESATEKKGLGLGIKIGIIVILIIAALAAYSFFQPFLPTTPSKEPQDFTLPIVDQNGLTGKTVTLSSFRGKVILLDLMEPWCGRCQNMSPILDRLYQEFEPQGVIFLSVAGPRRNATVSDAAKFIRDYKPTWTYTYDSSGEVFTMYNVAKTPTYYIIAKDFTVATTYEAETPYDSLATWLNRLTSGSMLGK